MVVADVDTLPRWGGDRRHGVLAGGGASVVSLTAQRFEDPPPTLASLVQMVVQVQVQVQVPALRERPEDVVPLARHVARRVRGREVDISPAAQQALHDHGWPGNTDELRRVVRDAASRTDAIDGRHLPAEVLSDAGRRLTRIETFERDEVVRVLHRPGSTMREVALELGMSRATVYRTIAQYGIRLPRE